MKKLEKIDRQEQKTREKIAELQSILKKIDGQRTEQEDLQIVQQIRALKLSREELYAFLGGGVLPASLAGVLGGDGEDGNTDPAAANIQAETIYSRRNKNNKGGNGNFGGDTNSDNTDPSDPNTNTSDTDPSDQTNNGDTPNYESEGN